MHGFPDEQLLVNAINKVVKTGISADFQVRRKPQGPANRKCSGTQSIHRFIDVESEETPLRKSDRKLAVN